MPKERDAPSEDVDLEADRRQYVLDVYARLPTMSHYDVLGVARDGDSRDIKLAYFNLVGLVHPDRYFGKRLGSYKPKMEAIFGRLVQAYETLMRPEARRVYDATLAPRTAPAELPLDPRVAAKRQAAREALKQHFAGGRERARPHVEAAKRARANDDFVGAAQAYNKALTFLPNDASLRASLADVERLAGDRLRETLARQAAIQEDFGRWAEAAESWKRVIALRPNDPEAEQRLARALARMRRES